MGWFSNIARKIGSLGEFSGIYNSVKDTLGKVYNPIKNVVHTVGGVVDKVDDFVKNVAQKNIPVISNLAQTAQAHPYYQGVLRGSKMAEQYVDRAGEIGKMADSALTPLTEGADKIAGFTPKA